MNFRCGVWLSLQDRADCSPRLITAALIAGGNIRRRRSNGSARWTSSRYCPNWKQQEEITDLELWNIPLKSTNWSRYCDAEPQLNWCTCTNWNSAFTIQRTRQDPPARESAIQVGSPSCQSKTGSTSLVIPALALVMSSALSRNWLFWLNIQWLWIWLIVHWWNQIR